MWKPCLKLIVHGETAQALVNLKYTIMITQCTNKAVFGIRDILVRIRIRISGSLSLTNGSDSFRQ
jgi:hypothetical protein